jgi:hypothetical protein
LYLRPLREEFSTVLSNYDLNSLFKNAETLFDTNLKLLVRIQAQIAKAPIDQQIGEVFLGMVCIEQAIAATCRSAADDGYDRDCMLALV